jgi:hypothetical protein
MPAKSSGTQDTVFASEPAIEFPVHVVDGRPFRDLANVLEVECQRPDKVKCSYRQETDCARARQTDEELNEKSELLLHLGIQLRAARFRNLPAGPVAFPPFSAAPDFLASR